MFRGCTCPYDVRAAGSISLPLTFRVFGAYGSVQTRRRRLSISGARMPSPWRRGTPPCASTDVTCRLADLRVSPCAEGDARPIPREVSRGGSRNAYVTRPRSGDRCFYCLRERAAASIQGEERVGGWLSCDRRRIATCIRGLFMFDELAECPPAVLFTQVESSAV